MSRKLAVVVVSLLALGVALIMPARADDAIIKTHLTGAAERPGPGDPDAAGDAVIYIDDDTNFLCLSLKWGGVDGTPSGLHIHFAPPTAPGPVVVPFAVPPAGTTSTFQCVAVANEALLDNISVNPQQYYLNLHSTPLYPGGAIRGQLGNV
ncbi:MAG: CHRD domain-containing protein [Acidimicrobiales bacterium]